MTTPLRICNALACLVVMIGMSGARAADVSTIDGKAILEKHCGRCHSIAATGESALQKAPPLRQIYLSYPIEQLEGGFAEGMGSKHRDMPQIQFSAEEVAAIFGLPRQHYGHRPLETAARPRSQGNTALSIMYVKHLPSEPR
jgi:mono/diheme cytochrome c family protein